jgi:hypothetical protein
MPIFEFADTAAWRKFPRQFLACWRCQADFEVLPSSAIDIDLDQTLWLVPVNSVARPKAVANAAGAGRVIGTEA